MWSASRFPIRCVVVVRKAAPDAPADRGRVIDHIAFSFREIEPVFERLNKAGVKIVEPLAIRDQYRLKSFFVLGPDNVLIEIVEARPIPDASWDRR
jgi:hypothetical protein